ncbi:MAG TPA: acyl-CoA thioesterase II [Desulfuromonadales bacterium]|nr:acyl-CoA thioesterase II [Desulfuromonadales bacterium]
MTDLTEELLSHLALERLEDNLFRGQSRDLGGKSVFGGQVLGQALLAAHQTIEGRDVHSLHGYFLRPGDPQTPIIYDVERIRDGRSFATRRVVAIQHGQAIFNAAVSFQSAEEGFDHQLTMPEVPGPEGLTSFIELRRQAAERLPPARREVLTRERPIELRPVRPNDLFSPERRQPYQQVWIRAKGTLPDSDALHRAVLAYASDFSLLGTAFLPHGLSFYQPGVMAASLDHAMWFHRPFRADEWLLYAMDSPSASFGRGLARGSIYSFDGRLVASVAQEGVMRRRQA